jgi:hypothetical protein
MRRSDELHLELPFFGSRRKMLELNKEGRETRCCLDALEEALGRHRKPKIFNTDQGGQFTSAASPASSNRPNRDFDGRDNQMPIAVWRTGIYRNEAAARAVDMPLRLDNANALPTYHSRTETTEESGLRVSKSEESGRADVLHLNSNGPRSHEWGPLQFPLRRNSISCVPSMAAPVGMPFRAC